MGIKGWLTLGGTVLTVIAVGLGIKKKEDMHYEKIQKLIRNVDRKEPKEKTVEEIAEDINDAILDMGIDDDEEMMTDEKADEILKKGSVLLKKADDMLGDSEANRQEEAKVIAKIREMDPNWNKVNEGIKIVDNTIELKLAQERKEEEARRKELEEKMNDPEWLAEQERLRKEQEEKAEAEWRRKVKKAVEQKNFNRLEDLFDEKYAGGPWHPSPASVFGDAVNNGVIDDVFYHMAAEHFGKLWNYSGD